MVFKPIVVAVALAAGTAHAATPGLLVPDKIQDRVLLLDGFDGSVINDAFLDVAAAAASVGYTGGLSPVEARDVNGEVWVTDDRANRIWRFNRNGTFAGQFGVDDQGVGMIPGAGGFEVVGNTAFIAQTGNGMMPEGVITVDTLSGEITGSINPHNASETTFYDVQRVGNEIFVSNGNDDHAAIHRFGFDGTYLGAFATDVTLGSVYGQQINVRGSNGNVLLGGYFSPSGVYEFLPSGDDAWVIPGTEGSAPLGAYELGNGDILFTHGEWLSRLANGPVPVPPYGDERNPRFTFIGETTIPAPGAVGLATVACGFFHSRRRRA